MNILNGKNSIKIIKKIDKYGIFNLATSILFTINIVKNKITIKDIVGIIVILNTVENVTITS